MKVVSGVFIGWLCWHRWAIWHWLEGEDGTKVWVPNTSEADDFTTDAIFLVGKSCERGERNSGEVRQGKGQCIGA